jgi:hypothetical protein
MAMGGYYAIEHPRLGLLAWVNGGIQMSGWDYRVRFKVTRLPGTSALGSFTLATGVHFDHYLTAINGGGLVKESNAQVILRTDSTTIGSSEQFSLVDVGDCTFVIQTHSGSFFGDLGRSSYTIDTTASDFNNATRFRLIPVGL